MYLVPVDVWYIIPFDVVEGNLSLNLTPRKGHKFAQYMEGWNLLRGAGEEARKKSVASRRSCWLGKIYRPMKVGSSFRKRSAKWGTPRLPQCPASGCLPAAFPIPDAAEE